MWEGASQSPDPTGDWDLTRSSGADGSASLSGASATSSTNLVSGQAPTSYHHPGSATTPLGTPGMYPVFGSTASATTHAGPDSSADPSKENYGYETAASASGSTTISISAH